MRRPILALLLILALPACYYPISPPPVSPPSQPPGGPSLPPIPPGPTHPPVEPLPPSADAKAAHDAIQATDTEWTVVNRLAPRTPTVIPRDAGIPWYELRWYFAADGSKTMLYVRFDATTTKVRSKGLVQVGRP